MDWYWSLDQGLGTADTANKNERVKFFTIPHQIDSISLSVKVPLNEQLCPQWQQDNYSVTP